MSALATAMAAITKEDRQTRQEKAKEDTEKRIRIRAEKKVFSRAAKELRMSSVASQFARVIAELPKECGVRMKSVVQKSGYYRYGQSHTSHSVRISFSPAADSLTRGKELLGRRESVLKLHRFWDMQVVSVRRDKNAVQLGLWLPESAAYVSKNVAECTTRDILSSTKIVGMSPLCSWGSPYEGIVDDSVYSERATLADSFREFCRLAKERMEPQKYALLRKTIHHATPP